LLHLHQDIATYHMLGQQHAKYKVTLRKECPAPLHHTTYTIHNHSLWRLAVACGGCLCRSLGKNIPVQHCC
jgi:hypothetical protein